MSCLVSVIVPAYNAERWIGDALESALHQSWPAIEIIVIDDGSTDNTLTMAKRFESVRVKVMHQENQGVEAARNRAVSEAQGEFFQYLDADDLLSPDKIEAQVRLLGSGPSGLLAVSAAYYFQDGQDPESGIEEPSTRLETDDPVHWLTELYGPDGQRGMVPIGAWLTPRDVAEKAGPWNLTMRAQDNDGEYFARVVLASGGIRHSTPGRYYYRKFPQGVSYSSKLDEQLFWGRLHSIECEAKSLLARTSAPRAKRALANRYMDMAFGSYPYFPQITEEALKRVEELGGTHYAPSFGTWKGNLLRDLIGWKATKRLNVMLRGRRRTCN
jgi:glycosyltransferase involved in cell wall biosynthesis